MEINGYSNLMAAPNTSYSRKMIIDHICHSNAEFPKYDTFIEHSVDRRKLKKILKNKLYYNHWKYIMSKMINIKVNYFLTSEMIYLVKLEYIGEV